MRWLPVPHMDARYDRYGEFPLITIFEVLDNAVLFGGIGRDCRLTVYAYWRRDRERRRVA